MCVFVTYSKFYNFFHLATPSQLKTKKIVVSLSSICLHFSGDNFRSKNKLGTGSNSPS